MRNRPIVLLFMLLVSVCGYGQSKICGVWYTDGLSSKVQIYLAVDGKYYGKIVWLRDSVVNGQRPLDTKNPDKNKRSQTWINMLIITGLEKKSETEYVNGKIYDPVHGNYYSCKMTIAANGNLELRGYILGMSFLGRTTTWTPCVPDTPKPTNPSQVKTTVKTPDKKL